MGGKGVRREGEGVREEGKGRSEGRQYTKTLVSITESNTVLYLQKVAEHWQFILEECDGQWIYISTFECTRKLTATKFPCPQASAYSLV